MRDRFADDLQLKPGDHVLDVGCGPGRLATVFAQRVAPSGSVDGIDPSPEMINRAIARARKHGVPARFEVAYAQQLPFADNAFDTVLCLSALQMMKNVEGVLRDIARVGADAIVSFPNFAYWPHRLSLLRGRMPVSKSLPYAWYDTPNLRCATINDFQDLASEVGLEVLEFVALDEAGKPVTFLPNWRGSLAIFRLRKRVAA